MKIFLDIFSIVGAFIILIGIGTIIEWLENKNLVKHTWQASLVLLIIALSIIALATIIKQ